MNPILKKIEGIPYCRAKTRGNVSGLSEWTGRIIEQTKDLPKIMDACILKVTFLLPPDKFPLDFPYGPDLDNLTKRLCDALKETIFSEAKRTDSCIIQLIATKSKVESSGQAGAFIEVLPIIV